ncbi:MAG: hypothetical protein M0T84_14655 [Betaproteobacteria bacterium]|nr:hypothetical protein [Betaproteobacteria bacterium]
MSQSPDGTYVFALPRGKSSLVDHWGPFSAPSPSAALAAAADLERKLARAGWFKLSRRGDGGWDEGEIGRCIAMLSRTAIIPLPLRRMLDEHLARIGRAQRRHYLRAGGMDVHVRQRRYVEGSRIVSEAEIAVVKPREDLDEAESPLFLKLDGLDALIKFLNAIRSTMAMDAGDRAEESAPRASDGIALLDKRLVASFGEGCSARSVIDGLVAARDGDLAAIVQMLDIVRSGDRIKVVMVAKDAGHDEPLMVLPQIGSETAARMTADASKGMPGVPLEFVDIVRAMH